MQLCERLEKRVVHAALNIRTRVVQPAARRVRGVRRRVAHNPRHHKEFRADPLAVRLVEDRRGSGDSVFVQQLLRQRLHAEVVLRKDASARGWNADDVLVGVPADGGGEDEAFARPARSLVRRAQFRYLRFAGEPVPEPRLKLSPGGGQVALRERDACHADNIYIRCTRCKAIIVYVHFTRCNTLAR